MMMMQASRDAYASLSAKAAARSHDYRREIRTENSPFHASLNPTAPLRVFQLLGLFGLLPLSLWVSKCIFYFSSLFAISCLWLVCPFLDSLWYRAKVL